uniref:Uncharacterized protein n=1 Tax=Glossina austeni TaxID=7395 RepID=A0A1A9VF64_GLOAU
MPNLMHKISFDTLKMKKLPEQSVVFETNPKLSPRGKTSSNEELFNKGTATDDDQKWPSDDFNWALNFSFRHLQPFANTIKIVVDDNLYSTSHIVLRAIRTMGSAVADETDLPLLATLTKSL